MNPINVVLASGSEVLPLNEAFMDAGIVILIVFAVLFIIFCLISISGAIFAAADKSAKAKTAAPAPAPVAPATPAAPAVEEEEFSSGTLKLKGCDEKTAAMIMAIVSDNTGIPLSELIFKSITLVEEKN